MTSPRSSSTFAISFAVVYAVAYVIAVEKNYALFTYHPALQKFGFLVQPPQDGPAMYWYGWIATSGIASFVASLIACAIPEGITRRLWPGWSWAIPVAVMIVFSYLLKGYFLR